MKNIIDYNLFMLQSRVSTMQQEIGRYKGMWRRESEKVLSAIEYRSR